MTDSLPLIGIVMISVGIGTMYSEGLGWISLGIGLIAYWVVKTKPYAK